MRTDDHKSLPATGARMSGMILAFFLEKMRAVAIVSGWLLFSFQPAAAELQNNFVTLGRLDAATERSLGVFSRPDILKEVAQIRGVPILAAIAMPENLAALQDAMQDLPAIFGDYPPRAIILSDAGLKLLPSPLATARASGAYILLGDGFFSTRGVSAIPVGERPRLLLHEWVHVLQFYYADVSRPGPFTLTTHSTLLDGWPEATGWERVDGDWQLPDTRHGETTRYGRTAPIEDQADALSFVLLGQPDRVSSSRVAFLETALDLSVTDLTEGVFTRPAGFMPLKRAQERIASMLDGLVPDHPDAQLWVAEDVTDAGALLADHATELERRGFETVTSVMSATDGRGVLTYVGEWSYGGKTARVGAVILPRSDKSVVVMRVLADTS